MAKIYGLFGAMTGKLADTVMSVRNGEQLARKYQPVVYNPSTAAQVAQRAKLKLLSQLSAVMAPVIAIRKEGSVSSRNLFTKINFPATSFETDKATVNLSAVKITKSVVSLPSVSASLTENGVSVTLEAAANDISRVVYCVFAKETDNTLRFLASSVVTSTGGATFATIITTPVDKSVVVYAYGVRDNTEAARVVFGEMEVPTAQQVAQVVTSRTLTEADVTLTETRYAQSLVSRDIDDEDERKAPATKKK